MKNLAPDAKPASEPGAPVSPAWDTVLASAQAAERRGFLLTCVGGLLAAAGAGHEIFRLVRPGPPPLIADVCRGDVIAVRSAYDAPRRPPLEDIADDLKAWVRGAREVSFDIDFAKRQVLKTYWMTRAGSQAEAMLKEWHKANDPIELAKSRSVRLERQTALPDVGDLAGNTWRLEWREVTTARDGSPISIVDWRMGLSFEIVPPTTREALQKDPHGLYVDAFHWEPIPQTRTTAEMAPPGGLR